MAQTTNYAQLLLMETDQNKNHTCTGCEEDFTEAQIAAHGLLCVKKERGNKLPQKEVG